MKYAIIGSITLMVLGFIGVVANEPKPTPVAPAITSTSTAPQPSPRLATAKPKPAASSLGAYDKEILRDMNKARAVAGLPALRESAALDRAAADKVRDLRMTGVFDHVGSDGQMSWHWFVSEGYPLAYGGENLAEDFPKAADAFAAYMASPTHRANILNPHYVDVGLFSEGIYEAVEFGSTI